eukprot:7282008-Pyramimonas_sp.AAC.1
MAQSPEPQLKDEAKTRFQSRTDKSRRGIYRAPRPSQSVLERSERAPERSVTEFVLAQATSDQSS